jgi:hydroxymethylpyrimidine pyrophosphatase-like HAD family hydrolase
LEEPTYLRSRKDLKRAASFERQHVKAFFLRSGTKIDKATSIKIVAEKLGIHREIIAVGNAGNDWR